LRERQEDIPLLAQHFLTKTGSSAEMAPGVLSALQAYPWKGNVRELENVIERAVILSHGQSIQLFHLPEEFQDLIAPASGTMSLEDIEQQHIIKVLRMAKDLDEAASILGIDPATLWRKRKKYGL
jgi:NtrC-family two-component system response regulator AlgB